MCAYCTFYIFRYFDIFQNIKEKDFEMHLKHDIDLYFPTVVASALSRGQGIVILS